MLTGTPPFPRDAATAVMYAQLSDPLRPRCPATGKDLPPAVDAVFARALAKGTCGIGSATAGSSPEGSARGFGPAAVTTRVQDAHPGASPGQ